MQGNIAGCLVEEFFDWVRQWMGLGGPEEPTGVEGLEDGEDLDLESDPVYRPSWAQLSPQ